MAGSVGDRLRVAALAWADAATYAFVVAAGVVAVAVVLGVGSGGGLGRANGLLFVSGFVLMIVATYMLWPSSPDELVDDPLAGRDSVPEAPDRTRFRTFVRACPPVRWLTPPPPGRRMTVGGKLFLASLLVLAGSYALEVAFVR